jgi:hypothetical protein
MANNQTFRFEISLSVLNHLGRHLYRSFGTVLGEAISNSWDADAKNVWIYVDRQKNSFLIKDDGAGMTAADFQDKFLKNRLFKKKGWFERVQIGAALHRPERHREIGAALVRGPHFRYFES